MRSVFGKGCFIFFIFGALLFSESSSSQTAKSKLAQPKESSKIVVPLRINTKVTSPIEIEIDFGEDDVDHPPHIIADRRFRIGDAPGGVLVMAEHVPWLSRYRLTVDTDADGDLKDEWHPNWIWGDAPVKVQVLRKWESGKQQRLPYVISKSITVDRCQELREVLSWTPHYRAEGRLKLGSRSILLAVLDRNGDGRFNHQDLQRGTSVGLDRNGDGKIGGEDEWLSGAEIIEHGGQSFLIGDLEEDGSAITLMPTSFRAAQRAEFAPTSVGGKDSRLHEPTDKLILLRLWDSTCLTCAEESASFKRLAVQFANALAIVSMNLDEPGRLEIARRVVKQFHRLPWRQVVTTQSASDPTVKRPGGTRNMRVVTPLLVLMDKRGVVHYAGSGGQDMSEVQPKLEKLMQARAREAEK